jgi:general secretion pathway protein D
MKSFLLTLVLVLTGLDILAQFPPGFQANTPGAGQRRNPRPGQITPPPPIQPGNPIANPNANPGNLPAFPFNPAPASPPEEMVPAGTIDFQGVDVSQVLDVYAKLVNRTIIRGSLPDAKIILKTQTPLTKVEAIEALQAVLALNNISVINIGEKFVKAVQSDQANGAGAPLDDTSVTNLPNLGSYVTHVVQLRYVKPSLMVPIIQPFAKLQGSIFPIDDNYILVIRDYAENVKRMIEMIDRIDVSVPAEYVSEVIPIRYAKVDDIANALNALGGSGGATVSIGSGASNQRISGLSGGGGGGGGFGGGGIGGGGGGGYNGLNSGANGYQGGNSSFGRSLGGANVNGTPSGGASTFAQRLNNIISKASGGGGGGAGGQDQIQLFGQTKIIPNESSSSLLVFATRQDLAEIKDIIAKLDVPLAQVLIEAVIMDISLGPNTFTFGVSAAQNPASLGGNVVGGGGYNNGQSFLGTLSGILTNSAGVTTVATNFASSLPGGFSYMANIGNQWDLAVAAAENDSTASVIQRPRIQTSQAQPAQFFVGETVPYVTSTYNYGGIGGNSSSYSQLSVGVELDVTPFINPEGAVTMEIQQEIDDLNGFTTITGVGQVPNTTKRTLNATMTVRDHDTVMLGGFIKTDKSHTASGVPFLDNIPLLGNLFSSRSDSHDREELIVLMRPTVLPTPELAAQHTIKEERRMPMVSSASADDADEERKLVEKERKKEMESAASGGSANGFFNAPQMEDTNEMTLPQDQLLGNPAVNGSAVPANPKADFDDKAHQINAATAMSPAQEAQLNALLERYMGNEISTQEYQAERARILSEQR